MMRIQTFAGVAGLALLLAATAHAQAQTAPANTPLVDDIPDLPDEAGTGLEFEPESVSRSFPVMGTYRAFLPAAADVSKWLPPVGNQGPQSSCVAWATSYGLRSYYENRRRGAPGAAPTFSPAYVYNQIKNRNAACNVGTWISDALNLMKRVGTVPLAEFPYDPRNCARLPGPDLASEARNFRIADWKTVNVRRLDDVKSQIFAGNPVVIGMQVNQKFHKLRGSSVFTDTGTDGSGHAMLVVAYDDRRNAVKLFNSWGRSWGDQGFGWVDYDAFQARTRSAFTMQVAGVGSGDTSERPRPPAPAPAPTPAPLPAPAKLRPTPAPEPAPAPRPQTVSLSDSQLTGLLSDIPCSVLRANRDNGGVTVRGVVGKAGDRDEIRQTLRDDAGVVSTKLDVEVMAWPQCEVRQTFAPALEKPQGLAIRIRPPAGAAAGAKPVLADGSPLVLDVTTPAFPSFLYVIYLQVGGEAVYVHTPAMTTGRPWPPGSRVTIGDGSRGTPSLVIGEPYGDEMILAVAAPFPLTSSELPEMTTEREFLTLFRRTLLGHGTRDVTAEKAGQAAAAYAVLTTRAGRP